MDRMAYIHAYSFYAQHLHVHIQCRKKNITIHGQYNALLHLHTKWSIRPWKDVNDGRLIRVS